jgi:hypothetical protein
MEGRLRIRRVSRRLVLASAASAALLLGVADSASAGTIDQQQTSSNANIGLQNDQTPAQTFTAGMSGRVDQVDLSLSKFGFPPNPVTVEIRNASGGQPGSTVLASTSIPLSAIGTTPAFVPATFAAPAPVTAGTQYSIVAWSHTTGDAVGWNYQNSDLYPGGAMFKSSQIVPPSPRGPWFGFAFDLAFKTYVAPPLPGGGVAAHCKHKKKKHKSGAVVAKKKCKKKKHHK